MTNSELIDNWQSVNNQIQQACNISHKQGGDDDNDNGNNSSNGVSLLAVSKTKPADMVATLAKAGQRDFGENYLQEAVDKIETVKTLLSDDTLSDERDVEIVWHYIGHIQRNKTRDIAEVFDWVHTIERDIIAKRLNNQRPDEMANLNVLIQVNIDNEQSKSGCLPDEVDELVTSVKQYERLNLRGLMIIPSKEGSDAFERTKKLFDAIKQAHPELKNWDTLSMGMSSDMQEAIKQGSTMVRVGSAIFGARD